MSQNRWLRLGVVLSVVWALGAAIHQRNADIDRAEDFAKFSYRICTDGKAVAHNADLTSCEQERKKNVAIWLEGSWGNTAFISLVPIPLGWFAAFGVLLASRGGAGCAFAKWV